jgi:uncharacterized protein YceK
MHKMMSLILLCGVCAVSGCAAIGSRVVGDGYFQGVRCDYAEMFHRDTIDPDSRIHPALAAIDMPFSFIGDILFLPYDACSGSGTSCRTNSTSSHE